MCCSAHHNIVPNQSMRNRVVVASSLVTLHERDISSDRGNAIRATTTVRYGTSAFPYDLAVSLRGGIVRGVATRGL